jgi:hypothetical protein
VIAYCLNIIYLSFEVEHLVAVGMVNRIFLTRKTCFEYIELELDILNGMPYKYMYIYTLRSLELFNKHQKTVVQFLANSCKEIIIKLTFVYHF